MRNDETTLPPEDALSRAVQNGIHAPGNGIPEPFIDVRDAHGNSLKRVMVDGLHKAMQQIVKEAYANSTLPVDHPDHASDAYINAVNALVLESGSRYAEAIKNCSDFGQMYENLESVMDWALAEDARDNVTIPEESFHYRTLADILDAGITHLDPQDKRFHLSTTVGDAVVQLNGANLLSRQAMYLEELKQRYHDRFNQQAVTIEHDEHALAELNADDLLPVEFARKGFVSESELRACIDDALKHTFCLYRDKAEEYTDSDLKEDLLERNASIYKDLRAHVAETITEEGALPALQVIMDVLDDMIARDIKARPHDNHEPLHATWVSDFISYLQDMVKVNTGKDNGADPQSANYLMVEFEEMQKLIDAYPQAREHCHRIIRDYYDSEGRETMHEVLANSQKLDLDTLDEEEYQALNGDIVDHLQEYMQTKFFDRVNALHLRGKQGPIALDFDCDDEGIAQTYMPHSYALVHQAYEMAKHVTPNKMKGTQMYDRQLHKNEDYFLSHLACSDAWECRYPDQYGYAQKILNDAYAAKTQGQSR